MLPPLSRAQRNIANATPKGVTFLHGPAGAGKTFAGVARALTLLGAKNIPPDALLILVPQRALALPYQAALRAHPKGAATPVVTFGGLAQRAIALFWPLVSADAGFANPAAPPTFLSLETAQAAMHTAVGELIARERFFDTVTIPRNRLYAQILTNLTRAAQLGLPHTAIGALLAQAWHGPDVQRGVYGEAQAVADAFRAYCLAHNLLDFSLQVELFMRHVWPLPGCQGHLFSQYRHLIADNVEEESSAAHSVLRPWLAHCTSALVVYDEDAGVRSFLGAEPESAWALRDAATRVVRLDEPRTSPATHALAQVFAAVLGDAPPPVPDAATVALARSALTLSDHGFPTQAHLWIADDIRRRIEAGTPPGDIVVLAPFLTDVPRFNIMARLAEHSVPAQSHRPSRALREEPAARALMAWAALAHPAWALPLAPEDVALALVESIEGMDWGRAMMLAARVVEGTLLPPFAALPPAVQQRVTFVLGQRWDVLRAWLDAARAAPPAPLDVFWRALFGEVLSQPGYGFRTLGRARVTADLADGAALFGMAAVAWSDDPAREYVVALREGLLGDLSVADVAAPDAAAGSVLVLPATTFLTRNRTARVQYWLDAASPGWWERVYQPLTHPHVLGQAWLERVRANPDVTWTDLDEIAARRGALCTLVTGLVRRCTDEVVLVFSEVGSQGDDQRGPLLLAAQRVLSGRVTPVGMAPPEHDDDDDALWLPTPEDGLP